MEKLFDVVGLENISTQIDDPIVSEIENAYEKVRKLMKQYRVKSTMHAQRFKEIGNVLTELDKKLEKRFGLPLKHLYDNSGNYAVVTVDYGLDSQISPYRVAILRNLKDYLSWCDSTGQCGAPKDGKQVKRSDEYYSIARDLLKSTKAMRDLIKSGKLEINREKAFVKGMPKNVNVFLLTDIHFMLVEMKVTPKELTAILLHEIGHAFTHLEYGANKLVTNAVLLDTFMQEMKSDKSLREVLVITAKEGLGKELKGETDAQVATDLIEHMVEYINENDKYTYTNSEQLADQFATRFGLGAELVTGLQKFREYYNGQSATMTEIAFFILITFLLFLLLTLNVAAAALLTLSGVIYTLIMEMLVKLIVGGDASARIYDMDETRYRRIKLDIIRQLRESQLDKKFIKNKLKEIQLIEDYIDAAVKKGILSALGDIMPWNINKFVQTRLQKELEVLSENDLHVKSKQFKLLGEA